MKLKPIANRILAKAIEAKSQLKGGLYLPDTAKKSQEQAEVVALGSANEDDFPVKVGDIILKGKYSGHPVTLDDEEFIILDTVDIIAILI